MLARPTDMGLMIFTAGEVHIYLKTVWVFGILFFVAERNAQHFVDLYVSLAVRVLQEGVVIKKKWRG